MSDKITTINQNLKAKADQKSFGVPPVVRCVQQGSSANLPQVRPCFEIRWGDSERDIIETNDDEVLYIVARNPYIDIMFKDLTVVTIVTELDGKPVPELPDGTPSVEITPSNIIYFGNLPKLNPQNIPPQPPDPNPDPPQHPDCQTPAPPPG